MFSVVADLSCPPGVNGDAVICLKFQISREIQARVIAKAEVGFAVSGARNHTFRLLEFRKDVHAGSNVASFEGKTSGGEFQSDRHDCSVGRRLSDCRRWD